jgi:putative ABC transport system permease protein
MPDIDWKAIVRSTFGSRPPDDDVVEELALHAAATYEAARADGADPQAGLAHVKEQLGRWALDPVLFARRPGRPPAVEPPAGTESPMWSVLQDARHAVRLMRRQPAHTLTVIGIMALGIAATAVLGSVIYGVLLKPLPWAGAPRLVRLYETRQGSTRRFGPLMTNVTYLPWSENMRTLDAMGAWTGQRVTLTGAGEPVRLQATAVTPSLFPILGAAPMAGRLFVSDDAAGERPTTAVLSYALWQQRFGGGDAIGKTVTLDGDSYTVVGVMPASFMFPDRETRLWTAMRVKPMKDPGNPKATSISLFNALGRLGPGATPAQAASEGTAIGRGIPLEGTARMVAMAVFGSTGAVEVSAPPLLSDMVSKVRPAILVLFAAVLLLLATAAGNIASLQLARATGRRREMAIRTALGAGAGRLARQTLVENMLLGLLGGVTGLLLAWWLQRGLPSWLPPDFPRLDDVSLDVRVQLFAIAVALAAGFGFGLMPALQAARRDVRSALAEDALAPVGGSLRSRTARTRAAIMMAQVAIATVLLVGAALLGRSFVALLNVDIGYTNPSSTLLARLPLPDTSYTPERRMQVLTRVAERLRGEPGVAGVAWGDTAPFSGSTALASFPLKRRDGSQVQVQTGTRSVSPGYFAALGQRVQDGRPFAPTDDANAQAVVMVNREFARKYLDGRALGWSLPGENGVRRPIVGVVDDAVRREVTDTPQPEIYVCALQVPLRTSDISIVIRGTGDPHPIAPALRAAVREQDPLVPVEQIATLEDLVSRSVETPRLYATVLAAFAGFALIIAAVGLFGVLSQWVAQRAREIGVRSALGATARDIVLLVARQAAVIVVAGIAMGLLASFWAAGLMRSLLYGVTSHDGVAFGAVACVLIVVALTATLIPARRAAHVDPAKVLRA